MTAIGEIFWKPSCFSVRLDLFRSTGQQTPFFHTQRQNLDLEGGCALYDGMVFINTTREPAVRCMVSGDVGGARIQRGSAWLVMHHTLYGTLGKRRV